MAFMDQMRMKRIDLDVTTDSQKSGSRTITGWLKQASIEVKQAGVRSMSSIGNGGGGVGDASTTLTIIHFNDVYDVESRKEEPCGGAARFSTALKSLRHLNPLVLFSGDIFSPSVLSTFTKGEHMSHLLNEFGVKCAVFGNHEFDFGLETLSERIGETNFPWLMSNVIDNETGRPLGDGKVSHIIDWEGKRIGLIGLVEQDWIDTLATINANELTFMDFVEVAKSLSTQLKKEGCDYVVALTHMRLKNDIILAESDTDIDIILGGHDHVYEARLVNGKYMLKSGTDFRQFSKISVEFTGKKPEVKVEEMNITRTYDEDVAVKDILQRYEGLVKGKMDETLGTFAVPLEGRFCKLRTQETNLGNWICDVLLAASGADLVLLNSGTFRSDRVHPPGDFSLADLMRIIPKAEPTIEISIKGEVLLQALENSVSKYPELEGRFPQVAGVRFAFDPEKPPGQRVDPQFVKIGDEYLIMDQNYLLTTKHYVYNGSDGYTMMKNSKTVIGIELCPDVCLSILNHFSAIKMCQGKTKRLSKHRQSLVTLSRRHSLVKQFEGSDVDLGPSPIRRISQGSLASSSSNETNHTPSPKQRISRRASLEDLEHETCLLAPSTDNRIIKLTPEIRKQLLLERQRYEAEGVIPEEGDDNLSPQQSFDKSN